MGRLTILGHVHFADVDVEATVSLLALVQSARAAGFSQIDVTPHLRPPSEPNAGRSVPLPQLAEFWEKLRGNLQSLTADGSVGLRIGTEANICPWFDGPILSGVHSDISYFPDLDLVAPVITAFHFTPELGWPEGSYDPEWMLGGYLDLLDSYAPLDISIIGHPFEYATEPPTPEQLEALALYARDCGVALEVNCRRALKLGPGPWNRPLNERVWLLRPEYLLVLARTGVALYLGSDIHHPSELRHLDNLQSVARKLVDEGVAPEQVIGWEE